MNTQMFLREFHHVASAPGGMLQVRRMIYQLAVTGSLTPRGERLEDARALLAEIDATRQRLIRAKKYKRLLELESEAIRIPRGVELPANWCWTRLVDIGEINPRNDAENDELAAFLPMRGVPQVHHGSVVSETAKWVEIRKGYTHFANGDVLLAKITPCFENGKAAVITALPVSSGIGAGTTELLVFRPIHSGILPGYVYLFLRCPLFTVEGETNMTGTAGQKRLPTDYFATRAFPLPPLEEQGRIVAKVDALMALCDTLESQQQQRRTLQIVVRRSTLQTVGAATSSHDLQTAWFRLAENFGQIFRVPADVEELRRLVFDLAIHGLLSTRHDGDEAAEQLIDRSRAAKAILLSSGEMKRKTASSTDVIQIEIPNPEHWRKARLDDVFQFIDYRGNTPPKTPSGVVLVTAKNVRPGKLADQPIEYVSEASYREWMTRGFPRIGDILITTEAPLGNVATIQREPDFALAQRVIDLQPVADIDTQCAMYFMMSPSFQTLLEVNSTGMTAKGIKSAKLKQLLLPVPPKEEQARIVTRIMELLRICDTLESQLRHTNEMASRFATAAIFSITGISVQQEDEPLKVPKTELIAPVLLREAPDTNQQAPLATILIRHSGELAAEQLWQRFGGEIEAFYAQLKAEVAHGWIQEPAVAKMREIPSEQEAV